MSQAATDICGGRCQLPGDIVIQIENSDKDRVNYPVDERHRCQVQGNFAINMENLSNEAKEGTAEDEEPDGINEGEESDGINKEDESDGIDEGEESDGIDEVDESDGINKGEESDGISEDEESDVQEPFIHSTESGIHLSIYRAAMKGDWKDAEAIYLQNNIAFDAPITNHGQTALHIAVLAEQTHFVRHLLKELNNDGLNRHDNLGNTAPFCAAASGKKELFRLMTEKYRDLPMERNAADMLPLHVAAFFGHRDMVCYLYLITKDMLNRNDCTELLVCVVEADFYDIAIDLVQRNQRLALEENRFGVTTLDVLAGKPFVDNACLEKTRELIQLICEQMAMANKSQISKLVAKHWRLIFVIAEQGNHEFLRIIIRTFPDLVFKCNDDGLTIFHLAVVNRHEKVFRLIYEIGSYKHVISRIIDEDGNNILHLAGTLPSPKRLNIVPGEALQLQRELVWFEKVKELVGPALVNAKNKFNKTPHDIFMETHDELIKKGEKWMWKTAKSGIIVAILVVTVAFAAAFTLPGGNNQNTGFPLFLHKASFRTFAISDAISLLCSIISLLAFLSILTPAYSLEDFVHSLPRLLFIGLAALTLSIIMMIVSFTGAFFLYFTHQWVVIYILIAAVVATTLIILHSEPFYYIHLFNILMRSAYKSMIDSQFGPDKKNPLFPAAKRSTKAT